MFAFRVRDKVNDKLKEELEEEKKKNEELTERNEELFDQANQCAEKQLEDRTVQEDITSINSFLGSFASIATGFGFASINALLGAVGSINWCGNVIQVPPSSNGEEDDFVIHPVEIDGVLTYPNINATIKHASIATVKSIEQLSSTNTAEFEDIANKLQTIISIMLQRPS